MLTYYEVLIINHRLKKISNTWSDLWMILYYLQIGIGRLIDLKYSDINDVHIHVKQKGRLKEKFIPVPQTVIKIINRRKETYPDDIFVFQSHSNRVKYLKKPVTIIAFNRALKLAAAGVTSNIVTSKCV